MVLIFDVFYEYLNCHDFQFRIGWKYIYITSPRNMSSLLLSAPILATITYAAIAGTYLLVIPLILLFYFKARWYKTGSLERVLLCFLVFFFFPGLLLLSPFFNFRPEARQI